MIKCGEGSAFDEYYSGHPGNNFHKHKEPKYKDTHRETEEEKKSPPSYSGGYSPDSN